MRAFSVYSLKQDLYWTLVVRGDSFSPSMFLHFPPRFASISVAREVEKMHRLLAPQRSRDVLTSYWVGVATATRTTFMLSNCWSVAINPD